MLVARRISSVFGAMLVVLLVPLLAGASPRITKTYSYFSISGRTADDLDNQLQKHGPLTRSTGFRHPGATQIKFGGEVTYLETDRNCSIGDVNVTLKTHITLPRWVNRRQATDTLGLIWDTLSADIKRHEERHAEIARGYARKLEDSLQSLGSRKTCKELENEVSLLTKSMIEDHDRDQLQFDIIESKNFDSRMMRLLKNRSAGAN